MVVDAIPVSSGTRVRCVRQTDGGDVTDESWARVDQVNRGRGRTRGRSSERIVYDVVTDNRGYSKSRRRGPSKWETERRPMPRHAGYGSESDI